MAGLVRRPLGAAPSGLKSTVPFGGFPWGVVGFGQADGPLLPLAQIGGAPLVSFAVTLLGFGLAALAFEIVDWWRRGGDRSPTGSAPPAVVLPGACICLVLIADRRSSRPPSGIPVPAPPTNRRSTSRPCRATCRGSAWTSTPSAARCSTTTCGRRCGLPRTCAPAGRRSRCSSSGRRTPRTSTRWPTPTPRDQIAAAAAAIKRADPGGRRARRARLHAATTRCRRTRSSSGIPGTGPGDRHDKQIVQPFGEYLPWRSFFTPLCRPTPTGPATSCPGSGNGVVERGRRAGRGDDLLGGDLRPRGARVGAQRRPAAGGAHQQRHLQRGDERAAAGVRPAARRRARPRTSSSRAPPGSAPSSRPTAASLARTGFFDPPTSTCRSG